MPGIGEVLARTIAESLRGEEPVYLRRLEATGGQPIAELGAALRSALRGDCHVHSDWSDGGSPIREMAEAARGLGHEYMVLTDHSPRLTVANGLSAERLERQLEEVAQLNAELAPFRILTGIEVDILSDGSLDQDPALLARLDLVVGSVHSELQMAEGPMTRRLVTALANPHARRARAHDRQDGGREATAPALDLRRGDRLRRRRCASTRRSRSTRARSGSTRRSGSCAWRSRPAAASRSTRTRTRRGSWRGSPTAAIGPPPAASRRARSSTPWMPTALRAWAAAHEA